MGGGRQFKVGVAAVAGILALVLTSVPRARAADSMSGNGSAPPMPVIEIWKGRRLMELRVGDQVVRQFEVALGYSPASQKRIRGDARTPVGHYQICSKKPASQFHRFLGLNYPNTDD